MAHPTAIWIRGARSTKNVAAPMIGRCTRSRCSRTTACTRCRTWRGRPTGLRGRRTALGRWRRSSRRGSPSIPTARGSSRRSIASASATRGSATSSRRAPRSTSTAWSRRPATRRASPRSFAPTSARVTSRPRRAGAVWTQGSPRIEEAMYWLNLLVDTTLPICGNAAQRPHGQVSNDGDKNIVDSVEYIVSRVWADEAGRNRAGVVLVQDQQVFAARDVQKADARPGGYVTTGGHGGILGAAGWEGPALLTYVPATRHTYLSAVNITRLPADVGGHLKTGEPRVPIKDRRGDLLESAIPKVTIVKDGNYTTDDDDDDPSREVDLLAQIERNLTAHPLAGFVVEGLSPYGRLTSAVRTRLMRRAAFSGMPVVLTGRGNAEGFVPPPSPR